MAKRGFVGRGLVGRGLVDTLMAGAALALVPSPAVAQDVRDLDGEQSNVRSFAGTLHDGKAVFEVNVSPNSVMRIDVIGTGGLDSTLKVTDVASGETLAEDDDSGGDLNPRVNIRGADGRRIRIEVAQFGLGEFDAEEDIDGEYVAPNRFVVTLTDVVHNPQSLRSVTYGSALGGSLLGEEEHEFSFVGEAGQLLDVSLLAGEEAGLDPFLELRDDAGTVIASNDDSGGGLNSRLRYVMPASGTYTIVASDLGDSGGDYTLRVAEHREVVVQAPEQMIGIKDQATGRLGAGFENGDIDPAMITYRLTDAAIASIMGGKGELTIRMNTGEIDDELTDNLDPMIELGFETPIGWAMVDSDDDGAGNGLNSMLPIDLTALAQNRDMLSQLRIRAKAFGGAGEYTLTITEGMEARPVYDDAAEYPIPTVAPPPPVRIYD